MFRNKYLRQLRDVQSRIKDCNEHIAKLSLPKASFRVECDIYSWLCSLLRPDNLQVRTFHDMFFTGFDDANLDYLYKLGEYFINVSEYEKAKIKYTKELDQLQEEERRLKEKLGIE